MVILLILNTLLVLCILLIIRNYMVHNYRMKILKQMEKSLRIDSYEQWDKKMNYFKSISYDKMVFNFWKPVNKFYDEKIFNQ